MYDKYQNNVKANNTAATVTANKKTAYEGTQVPASATKGLVTAAATKKTACETAWKTAKKSADAFVEPLKTDAAPYRKEVEAVQTALTAYAKKIATDKSKVSETEDDVILAAIAKRNAERDKLNAAFPGNAAQTTFAPVEVEQDAWFDAARTLGHTYGRTKRLQGFVDIVNAAGIKPFTQYARDNWPYEPEEFYAESYSLWLTDPVFLSTNYKAVYDYFQTGAYRK
jgi:hypothetical protein